MTIEVINKVTIKEIDGEDAPIGKKLEVVSHWNINKLVTLKVPGAKPITVSAKELEAAIANASNIVRF